ncbi:hypothetical protein Tco_1117524 [Tanacetum coccineum]
MEELVSLIMPLILLLLRLIKLQGPLSPFTADQINRIMALISSKSDSSDLQSCAAGATQHMTFSTEHLYDVVDVSHLKITVSHPNGTVELVKHIVFVSSKWEETGVFQIRLSPKQAKCMRTRSQARNRNRRQQQITPVIVEEPEIPMADNRTMAQLLQAPTEGYEDAIVIPEINANFELKHGLINLVQNKQFFGHDKEDPHAHIRYFNKITSTMRFPDVPSTSIKLMLFSHFSLKGSGPDLARKELLDRY